MVQRATNGRRRAHAGVFVACCMYATYAMHAACTLDECSSMLCMQTCMNEWPQAGMCPCLRTHVCRDAYACRFSGTHACMPAYLYACLSTHMHTFMPAHGSRNRKEMLYWEYLHASRHPVFLLQVYMHTCCAVSCCGMPYRSVLWHAVPRHAMACRAVQYCGMPCRAVLRRGVARHDMMLVCTPECVKMCMRACVRAHMHAYMRTRKIQFTRSAAGLSAITSQSACQAAITAANNVCM